MRNYNEHRLDQKSEWKGRESKIELLVYTSSYSRRNREDLPNSF